MRGFTLVECLVSIVILCLLIVGIYGVLNTGTMGFDTDMGLLELQQQARQAMNAMIKELRQTRSSDITISNAGARVDFRIPTDITTSPPTYSGFIAYSLNTDNQIIRQHAGTNTVLANHINNLSFCCWQGSICDANCLNAEVLQIQLGAQKTVKQRVLSFSLTEKGRLRNE